MKVGKKLKEPIDWLNYYYDIYGEFKCAVEFSKTYWKYFTFKSKEFRDFWKNIPDMQPNHRYVFDDELIIEGDLPTQKQNLANSLKIDKRLNELNISYREFTSGNKSYHYHTFWPELRGKDSFERKLYKQTLLGFIFKCKYHNGPKCKENLKSGNPCLINKYGIDYQLTGKHLIRLEGGLHLKTDRNKVMITETDYGINKIPQEVKSIVENILTKVTKWEGKTPVLSDKANCIKLFMTTPLTDCRKRIAFFILSRCIAKKLPIEKTKFILTNWNDKINKGHLRNGTLIAMINSDYRNKSKYPASCPYAHNLLCELGKSDVCKGCDYGKFKTARTNNSKERN